jgi:hypothetical protein
MRGPPDACSSLAPFYNFILQKEMHVTGDWFSTLRCFNGSEEK